MRYSRLEAVDKAVSAIGLGCASLGSRAGRRESLNIIDAACDAGINLFDTAPLYGEGDSESILGTALRGRRDKVVISTKVGWFPSQTLALLSNFKQVVRLLLRALPQERSSKLQRLAQGFIRTNNRVDLSPHAILQSVDSSLKRLRTDYVAFLLLHQMPKSDEIEVAVAALKALVQEGKGSSIWSVSAQHRRSIYVARDEGQWYLRSPTRTSSTEL